MSTETRRPYDFLDPIDPNADQAAEKVRRDQEKEDIKWLMAHPAGRRIAARILEVTGTRRTVFNPSGSVMALNEGKRQVGLWFEAELLDAAHEGYLKLLKEYASE